MKEKIAVFPGSFSPFTLGHQYVIKKALPLFDKIIIAVNFILCLHGLASSKNISFLNNRE